jgi:tetratricopeptide (TPR) repeat protein
MASCSACLRSPKAGTSARRCTSCSLSGAGQIHLQLGHPEQALAFFKRALQVNPNLAENLGPAIELLEQQARKGRTTT